MYGYDMSCFEPDFELCQARGHKANPDTSPSGERKRMLYKTYKRTYATCKTVPGTYDAATKTVEVIIPTGYVKL